MAGNLARLVKLLLNALSQRLSELANYCIVSDDCCVVFGFACVVMSVGPQSAAVSAD